jgi:hypothetical protein
LHVCHSRAALPKAIRIVHRRYYFWRKIIDELKRLGNCIGKHDRHCAQEALARKVPRPTKAEAEQVRRDAAKWARG